MIIGIGIDIFKIERMNEFFELDNPKVLEAIFTQDELIEGRKSPIPNVYFSLRFSAKEAVFKAFNSGWPEGSNPSQIGTYNGADGEPYVVLTGEMEQMAQKRGVRKIFITLSSDGEYAIANALLEG